MLNGLVGKPFLWFIKRQSFLLVPSALFILSHLWQEDARRSPLPLTKGKRPVPCRTLVTSVPSGTKESPALQFIARFVGAQFIAPFGGGITAKWSVPSVPSGTLVPIVPLQKKNWVSSIIAPVGSAAIKAGSSCT